MADPKVAYTDDDGKSGISALSEQSSVVDERLLRTVEGRKFNTLTETYFLPADEDEWSRLNKQHMAIGLGLQGLFPNGDIVRAILQTKDGEGKSILDLGCGTGVWSLEMAKAYPRARVVGIDLAPVPIDPETKPPNCTFEIDNINNGLTHFDKQFDVINARLIGFGLQNFRKSMVDVARCLKPGGIVIWLDGDYDLYWGYPPKYMPPYSEAYPEGSGLQRIFYETRRAATAKGSDIFGMSLALDEGLWQQSDILDPATCQTASLLLPMGEWMKSDDINEAQLLGFVGKLMRQDIMAAHKGAQPVLLKAGWPQTVLDEWSSKADDEITNGKVSIRMRLAWGRRRGDSGQPAPALEPIPVDDSERPQVKYPHYEIYQTKEQSLAAVEKRKAGKNITPPPFPPSP